MNTESVQYYLDQYALGRLSPQEWDALRQLLKDPAHTHLLEACMDGQLEAAELDQSGYAMVTEEVLTAVLFKIKEEKDQGLLVADLDSAKATVPSSGAKVIRRVTFFSNTWFRYAAILLLIAGV